MEENLDRSFGLLIAYVVPGLIVLYGIELVWPGLVPWFSVSGTREPSVGGFLHLVLASLPVGLTISAIRWAVIDTVHHRTGIAKPEMDFSSLQENLTAFQLAVEHYYRYFQFYANSCVSVFVVALLSHVAAPPWKIWAYLLVVALEAVLFFASRDSLRRYYTRTERLLGGNGAE